MGQIIEAINNLTTHPNRRLGRSMLRSVAEEILEGRAEAPQIAAFLAALRVVGETDVEIGTFVEVMLRHATPFPRPADADVILDTCGTGGDRLHTFNISTTSALVCAAAGLRVAKHGNRSASSRCGSAELLAELGFPIGEPPEAAAARLLRDDFCFLFAPAYHPAMKHAAEARKSLRLRTLFNICGPLSNPARPSHQIVGVASPDLMEPVIRALATLGCRGALVVHGEDGMDEITTTRPTQALRLEASGHWHHLEINPGSLGIEPSTLSDLVGGDARANAAIVRRVLDGESGPRADIVNLNAAAALWITGMAESLVAGVEMARDVQSTGKAAALLDRLVAS